MDVQKAANQLMRWYAAEHATRPEGQLHQPAGREVNTLDRQQIALLERTAATERDRVIIRLLADTGMRSGELVERSPREICACRGSATTCGSK